MKKEEEEEPHHFQFSVFNRHYKRLDLVLTFKEKEKKKPPAYRGRKMA